MGNIELGIAIKKARETKGLTKAELAQRIGSNEVTLWQLEKGVANSTMRILRAIEIELDLQIFKI